MAATHGTHCNVHYSRPKRCKFCRKTIIWYSCDHLSVQGLPLDSRDPWIEHKCHRFNYHRWQREVGSTPIGKFISDEMSDGQTQSFDAVIRLNGQLLKQRNQDRPEINRITKSISERVRLSEILLQLPEPLQGKAFELPEDIKTRRRRLLDQRTHLLQWRDELLANR